MIAAVAAALLVGGRASAQIIAMGEIGFDYSGSSSTDVGGGVTTKVKGANAYSFTFAPGAGYYFTDNMAVGLSLGLSVIDTISGDKSLKHKTGIFSFTPLFHWDLFKIGKFGINAEARVNLGFGWDYTTFTASGVTTKTQHPAPLLFGINIAPGLSYAVSDNIILVTKINLMRFGYNFKRMKVSENDGSGAKWSSTDIEHNFSFGFQTNDLLTLGGISIGMIYKF